MCAQIFLSGQCVALKHPFTAIIRSDVSNHTHRQTHTPSQHFQPYPFSQSTLNVMINTHCQPFWNRRVDWASNKRLHSFSVIVAEIWMLPSFECTGTWPMVYWSTEWQFTCFFLCLLVHSCPMCHATDPLGQLQRTLPGAELMLLAWDHFQLVTPSLPKLHVKWTVLWNTTSES